MELLIVNQKTFEVEIAPELKFIHCFDKLIKQDKTANKEKVKKLLAYIRLVCHYKSPYFTLPEKERKVQVSNDIFKEVITEDELLKQCMSYYVERTNTITMKLLVTAKEGILSSNKTIENINIAIKKQNDLIENLDSETVEGDTGELYDTAMDRVIKLNSDLIKTSALISSQIESIDKLENRVKQEISQATRGKAGADKAPFEDPE